MSNMFQNEVPRDVGNDINVCARPDNLMVVKFCVTAHAA
jgi:hypothetical protein